MCQVNIRASRKHIEFMVLLGLFTAQLFLAVFCNLVSGKICTVTIRSIISVSLLINDRAIFNCITSWYNFFFKYQFNFRFRISKFKFRCKSFWFFLHLQFYNDIVSVKCFFHVFLHDIVSASAGFIISCASVNFSEIRLCWREVCKQRYVNSFVVRSVFFM